MSPRLQVGIDFHRNQVDFALLHPEGDLIDDHLPFPNTLPGFRAAKEALLETLQAGGFDGLDIAGEATSLYWLPFYLHLFQDPDLAAYHPRQYLLNARWVAKYKESQSPQNKDDQTDPGLIAQYIQAYHPAIVWKFNPKWLSLRFYTRLRFHLAHSLSREKAYLSLYLFLAFNTYTHRKVFSTPYAKTSEKLLTQPEQLLAMTDWGVEELQKALEELSPRTLPNSLQNAQRLSQVLQENFPLEDHLQEPIFLAIQLLFETVRHLQDQMARVDEQITARVSAGAYPEVGWLKSIPGIGWVFAAGIAAEIGGLERFEEIRKWDKKRKVYRRRTSPEVVDAIAKFAGLWWPKNASGQFEAEERRLSRKGSAYLRYYLIEAANSLRQHDRRFAQYYQKKFDQAMKHKHKRAVVLTATKALDLFVALLRQQQAYQPKEMPSSKTEP